MFKLFKNLTKRDKLFILLCVVFILGQVGLELKLPEYMEEITLLVIRPGNELSQILDIG